MKKRSFIMLIALLLLGILAAPYGLSIAKQPVLKNSVSTFVATELSTPTSSPNIASDTATPAQRMTPVSIFADGLPNTSQAWEIIHTIQRAHEIEVKAANTFDLSEFSTVFINDPRFAVPSNWLKVVRKATNNPNLEKAGYLEYKIAYFTIWGEDVQRYKASLQLLPPTNTPEPTPTAPPPPLGAQLVIGSSPPPLIFKSMNINDDVATVVVDKGARIFEYILVSVNGQWYIASGNIISINP